MEVSHTILNYDLNQSIGQRKSKKYNEISSRHFNYYRYLGYWYARILIYGVKFVKTLSSAMFDLEIFESFFSRTIRNHQKKTTIQSSV